MDDLHRSKFNLVAVNRLPSVLDRADLEALFAEMTPRFFSIDALEQHIFTAGQGGIVMAVVEKEKAVSDLSDVVGRLEIKSKNDVDKYKKKLTQSSAMMFGGGNDQQKSLVQEYGPYIFCFPIGGAQTNNKKIAKYFNALPNS